MVRGSGIRGGCMMEAEFELDLEEVDGRQVEIWRAIPCAHVVAPYPTQLFSML